MKRVRDHKTGSIPTVVCTLDHHIAIHWLGSTAMTCDLLHASIMFTDMLSILTEHQDNYIVLYIILYLYASQVSHLGAQSQPLLEDEGGVAMAGVDPGLGVLVRVHAVVV